ncbi:MAG: DUF3108 domain-containing protein [Bryobacterales bacterium]|nr:DUF3108 domain-containing protein [Bryobacterales bacterium]
MKALTALLIIPALFAETETLRYSINWPSGLSLGEATLTASTNAGGGTLGLTLEAVVPGFPIRDEYKSTVGSNYCSVTFIKDSTHGLRKSAETSEFDASRRVVVRKTNKGGQSETATPACAKDALAFLYFVREELKQGRMPAAQPVFFGAAYQLRMQYGGTEAVTVGNQREQCDRLSVSVKGAASEHGFEILFARDQARTPVQVRVPFSMGTFRMELIRE